MAIRRMINIVVFMTMLFMMLTSCSKDDSEKTNNKPIDETQYYVKYEASSSTGNGYGSSITVNYTSEDLSDKTYSNSHKVLKALSWNGICGPFKKGQTVNLKVEGSHSVSGRISVSKNDEPFVLKKEGKDLYSIKLSYTIE